MNWLSLPWRRRAQPTTNLKLLKRARLRIEALEDRTVPTLFEVVPLASPIDPGHFHDLASAIAAAATLGDTIQIDAGSVPGNGATGAKVLTLQGNPNNSAVSLPQIGTLVLQSNGNILNDLNIGSVGFANGAKGQSVKNCLIVNISESPGQQLNGGNIISYNTITNSLVMGSGGSIAPGAVNDTITNNVFTNTAAGVALLVIAHDNGAVISGNSLTDTATGVLGIQVEESLNVTVSNNIIILTNVNSKGIVIDNPEFDVTVTVSNNRIDTAGFGTGLFTNKTAGHALNVVASGNDFVLNLIGIDMTGDGGTIDAGGGPLNSRAGNDFHGFVTTLGGQAAIQTEPGTTGAVFAQSNIFSAITPSSVVNAQGAAIVVSSELSPDQAFVQSLYNAYLHRSGELSELNAWIGALPGLGRQGVASGIIHSAEAYGVLVQHYHVKFFGRDATQAELTAGVNTLLSGATSEDLAANLIASPEVFARCAIIAPTPMDPNSNYAQVLYLLLLNRVPAPIEVGNTASIVTPTNRQAVALGFLRGTEFRTYAVQALYFTDPAFGPWSYLGIVPNMLHRQQLPSPGEISNWANSSYDLLTIESIIGGSGEFYAQG